MSHFILAVVSHTPSWVWGLLALLVAAGLSQVRTRDISAARVLAMPAAIVGLSLWSATSAFAPSGEAAVLGCWLVGAVLGYSANRVLDLPRGVRANADGSFRVPGSFAPLVLMLCVFTTRYANGVALAVKPALAATPGYALAATLVLAMPAGLLVARSRKIRASAGQGGGPALAA